MSALKKISPNLYQWSEFSVEKQLNFNGYYLICDGESVIIDPPGLADDDLQSLKNLVNLDPTIFYPYEINFHEKIMRILRNENECALERLRDKNKPGGLK